MKARFLSWWITYWKVISIIAIIAFIVFIIVAYKLNLEWVGFNGGYPKEIAKNVPVKTDFGKKLGDLEKPQKKTLWDWLQLLIIPVSLSVGAAWFNARQNHDLEIAIDNQQETELQGYFDRMTDLLLNHRLRTSKAGYEVQNIARARTVTVLSHLGPKRTRSVLLFLYESGLLNRSKPIITLYEVDLRYVNLSGKNLCSVNLSNTDLRYANLSGANLSNADLSGANLSYVDLDNADLTKANLSDTIGTTPDQLKQAKSLYGTIMPDQA